jgi:hypothetical protein
MIKFDRKNSLTDEKEPYIGMDGKVVTMAQVSRANENGKQYFRFTAELDAPSGPMKVAGQLYEGLVPHIGGIPEVGAKMQFNASLADIKDGFNTRWNIGGSSADAITDSLLDAIDNL